MMLLNSARLFDRMRRERLDAIVATAPENVTYSSGFWAMSQWIRHGPQIYVLTPMTGRGEPCVVASTGLLDLAADRVAALDTWVADIRRYGFFAVEREVEACLDQASQRLEVMLQAPDDGDPVTSLVRAISDRDLQGATIGIDEAGIAPARMDELAAALPTTKFIRAAHIFRYARAVKTAEEVRRLRCAAAIAEESIAAALAVAAEGTTEAEMGRAFHSATIRAGGIPVLGCIGFGAHGAFCNVQPAACKLRRGDVIRFDVGGRFQHYRADIARNAVLGEPSSKAARYHRAIRAGLYRAYELIRPGTRTSSIFAAVVDAVRREGLPHYRRDHVGHGIGLDGYDAPNLTPSSTEVLEAGMVMCIETPYYELGFAGLQVEDMVLVTPDGVETLMTTGTELRVV